MSDPRLQKYRIQDPNSRTNRISISRSTYCHSGDARSAAARSSNTGASFGAYSNHVTTSNGSPRSLPKRNLRASAGISAMALVSFRERWAIISCRSSAARFHHSADFRIGIKAAQDASIEFDKKRLEAAGNRSSRVKNRVFRATPRKTQAVLPGSR